MKLYTIWDNNLVSMAVRNESEYNDNYFISLEDSAFGSIGSRWFNDDRYNTDPMVVIKYKIGVYRKNMNNYLKDISRAHQLIANLEEIKHNL